MVTKTPQEVCAIARQLYKGRATLPLDIILIDNIPYTWQTLTAWFAEAIFKRECNNNDSIILNHVPNNTAKPEYQAGMFILKNSYEELIVQLFEDWKLTSTLKDTYQGPVNIISLWKIYIMVMALASHYDMAGYLPETYNDSYYYPPLKPKTAPVKVKPPTKPAATAPQKTRQQLIDEVGYAAAHYRYVRHRCSTRSCMVKLGYGDCWAMSDYLYHELEARKINARIIQYKTTMSTAHRTVQIHNGKNWVNFDYGKYKIDKNFRVGSNYKYGKVLAGHG